jgi:hypothetical protein
MFIQIDRDNFRASLQANIRHDDRSCCIAYSPECTYKFRTYTQWLLQDT